MCTAAASESGFINFCPSSEHNHHESPESYVFDQHKVQPVVENRDPDDIQWLATL